MTPNLYLCARTLTSPLSWIPSKRSKMTDPEDLQRVEHWHSPVPGFYEYIPSRGWYLIHRDSNGDYEADSSDSVSLSLGSSTRSSRSSASSAQSQREEVRYCRILHRYFLASELEARCRWELVVRRKGEKPTKARFFQLDDGITWVLCWDEHGRFIHGPYRKWCFEKETGCMRPMRGGDE